MAGMSTPWWFDDPQRTEADRALQAIGEMRGVNWVCRDCFPLQVTKLHRPCIAHQMKDEGRMRDEQITDAVLTTVLDNLVKYSQQLDTFAEQLTLMRVRMEQLEIGLRRIEAGLRNRGSL
jgi:hypothetical protein